MQSSNNGSLTEVVVAKHLQYLNLSQLMTFDAVIDQAMKHKQIGINYILTFLASQDALEVMRVTHSLSHWVSVSIDFTDVTLVSDDTYRRLYWCDPDDPDESYLVMKVI